MKDERLSARHSPSARANAKRQSAAAGVLPRRAVSLPGVPIMRYGDEIGMGDDLALEERYVVRTPMQWAGSAGGGFSAADPDTAVAP